MLSKKLKIFFIVTALVIMATGVGVYAAASYGSQEDPLITKSYLDKVLTPALEAKFSSALGSSVGTFAVLDLQSGTSIVAPAGCEIILRSGSATANSKATGLIDTTGGTTTSSGSSLSANHLYMVSEEGDGITAGNGGAEILICGSYSIY